MNQPARLPDKIRDRVNAGHAKLACLSKDRCGHHQPRIGVSGHQNRTCGGDATIGQDALGDLVLSSNFRFVPIAVLPARSRLAPFAECSLSVRWLREAHVAKHFGVEKPTQELRSFFARWSIKFSAEYDEAKGRQASGVPSSNSSKLRTLS